MSLLKKLLVASALAVLVGLIVVFLGSKYWNLVRYGSLVTDIEAGEAIRKTYIGPALSQEEIDSLTPDQLLLESQELEEEINLLAVSTGEVSQFTMENAYTGEPIGEATSLKAITKNNQGQIIAIEIVLQISPLDNLNKNIIPAFIAQAALAKSATLPGEIGERLSQDQIAQLFPKGSIWLFNLIIETSFDLNQVEQEYSFYTKRFYGDGIEDLRSFTESGLTTGYNKPILIGGLDEYRETAQPQNQ